MASSIKDGCLTSRFEMPYYVSDVNPDYTAALGLFQHLNTEELQKLLNDDSRVESMVKDLQQVKNAESEREMLLASNKSLADFNLSREPKMRQSRQQIKELYEQAQELMQEVEQRKKTLDSMGGQSSLETMLALLQTSAAQSEEDSEKIASSFLEGETTVESFLEQFADARKLAHLRRVKVDKMTELLTNRSRNPSRLPGGAPPPLPSRPAPPAPAPMPSYPPAGAAPYPVAHFAMPMPWQ
ncbi:vacuolar protein sorting-associated protein 37B isoform X1 [Ixodes scapularis]|uniref:vacuolar protein sorting-associated protein 37B isoform X1 n=2 Tax=Ixodes scapularis TaxID=6945 RepID=UPI001C385172|nr:vacuolar protein sorting-associated protein 37B isoform X1 [Ixodes scapularis]